MVSDLRRKKCPVCGNELRVLGCYHGHCNDALGEHRKAARFTAAEAMRGGKRVERAPMLDEDGAPDEH